MCAPHPLSSGSSGVSCTLYRCCAFTKAYFLKKAELTSVVSVVIITPNKTLQDVPHGECTQDARAGDRKHVKRFIGCIVAAVYLSLLSRAECRVGQRGLCLEDNLRELRAAITAGGHFPQHCWKCTVQFLCTHMLRRLRQQSDRETFRHFAPEKREMSL